MIEKALSGSRRYWTWITVLILFIIVGFVFYLRQLSIGLGITGMGRNVSWGLYIANFTFLVGVAASAVIVVLPYYLHDYKLFGRITVLGEFLAISAVVMTTLFIFVDLGQPERVLNIILYPSPRSLLFWDMVVLSVYLILNIVIGWYTLDAEHKSIAAPAWTRPLIIISIPWAISIHTVTAFIYSGLGARPFWLTALLAPRFLASAFASGPSLLIILCLIIKRFTRFDPGREAIRKVALVVTYALCINIFFFLVEIFTVFYSSLPEHLGYFRYLFFGLNGHASLTPWIWFSMVLAWISLILMLNPAVRKNDTALAVVSIAIILSIWIEKGIGLVVAGFIPSPLGEIFEYSPTLPEILISTGIYSLGLLILTVLFKVATAVKAEH
ncbi:MAG: Polysulfide reductase, NrfD [Syntrophorhabdus sp. PtaU1.Bin058]|nr:MAG: Polysulfide reductase, NrfD [Syntrophorhabdus sp. PtaU1.Bin058]